MIEESCIQGAVLPQETQSVPFENKGSIEVIRIEKLSIEERIDYFLNNQKTLEQIQKFPENFREKIIGNIIEYLILFPDCADIHRYIDDIELLVRSSKKPISDRNFNRDKINTFINHVAKELSMDAVDSDEKRGKVYEFFRENFIENGYCFHSFNGVFEDSINKNGLTPDVRFWDWSELESINTICSRAGCMRVLGWSDLNCKEKISISDRADDIYGYGVSSPEWFAQFVAGNFNIPAREPYDKKSYYRGDYAHSKNNVMLLCERMMSSSEDDILSGKAYPNITMEEQVEILKFFEKYWHLFVKQNNFPKCALIERAALNMNTTDLETYAEYCKVTQEEGLVDCSLEDAIHLLISSNDFDTQIGEGIARENLRIVNLPLYNLVYPK